MEMMFEQSLVAVLQLLCEFLATSAAMLVTFATALVAVLSPYGDPCATFAQSEDKLETITDNVQNNGRSQHYSVNSLDRVCLLRKLCRGYHSSSGFELPVAMCQDKVFFQDTMNK